MRNRLRRLSAIVAVLFGSSMLPMAAASAAGLPTVTTGAATNITSTSATLNGTVNPNGADTTCRLQYGLTTAYGVPGTTQDMGAGTTSVPVSETDTGLTPNTTYHFRLNCTNSFGNVKGLDASFTTSSSSQTGPPTVTTDAASNIASTSATLNGTANPNGLDTTCRLQYGLTTSYGTAGTTQDIGAGSSDVPVSETDTGLTPSTTYHFRLNCTNSAGNVVGSDATFTTTAGGTATAPTVSGLSATGITSTSATLNGTVNPNGADATCHFGYGLTTAYGTALPNQDAGAGTSPVNLSSVASGLTPSTLYHYHLHCTNSVGAGDSGDGTFTTSASAGNTVDHIVWITMENHGYADIIGNTTSAPYENNTLAANYGSMTNMLSNTTTYHPSLPNYLDETSGSVDGDCPNGNTACYDGSPPSPGGPLAVNNIFHQLTGGGARSLEESMPSNCGYANSGNYAVRHNPQVYYNSANSGADSATSKSADCTADNVPLGATPDLSASFTFITPNLCHDMHSNTCTGSSDPIKQGDDWLSTFVPTLLNSSQYQAGHTVIFITWDESASGADHIPTFVIDPFGAHDTSACQGSAYTHGSMLKYVEDTFGKTELGDAVGATSLSGCFGLP